MKHAPQILPEDFIQEPAEARVHTLHLPRLTWVILSSFLFTRFDVFYFSLCQGSFAHMKVFPTHPTPVPMQAEVAGPTEVSCLRRGCVSTCTWWSLGSKSTPRKEQVGLPLAGDRKPLVADVEAFYKWAALEDSEPDPPGSFSPSFWYFSYPKPEPLCSAQQKTNPTVMTKGSGSSIHACVHDTDYHCLLASWGKRTNSLYFFFLYFDPKSKKATVTRTHKSPPVQAEYRSPAFTQEIKHRTKQDQEAETLIWFLLSALFISYRATPMIFIKPSSMNASL